MYCTYITIYRGKQLPPFYIGHSSLDRIETGYRGSVSSKEYKSAWREELKNNPQFFTTKILSTHKTKKEAREREYTILKSLNVHKNPLYVNMAIQGMHLYYDRTGIKHSSETLEKLRNRPKHKHTPETRRKISEKNKGVKRSEEFKKAVGDKHRGKVESEETRRKKSISHTGKRHSVDTLKKLSTNSGRAVPIVIDGVEYRSIKEASIALFPGKWVNPKKIRSLAST